MVILQCMFRSYLARSKADVLLSENQVSDEQYRLELLRQRELVELIKMNSPSQVKQRVQTALVGEDLLYQPASRICCFQDTPLVFDLQDASELSRSFAAMLTSNDSVRNHLHLLDCDLIIDSSDFYPSGWVAVLVCTVFLMGGCVGWQSVGWLYI